MFNDILVYTCVYMCCICLYCCRFLINILYSFVNAENFSKIPIIKIVTIYRLNCCGCLWVCVQYACLIFIVQCTCIIVLCYQIKIACVQMEMRFEMVNALRVLFWARLSPVAFRCLFHFISFYLKFSYLWPFLSFRKADSKVTFKEIGTFLLLLTNSLFLSFSFYLFLVLNLRSIFFKHSSLTPEIAVSLLLLP